MIYLKLHIGLGDIIAQSAIINKIAAYEDCVILPCYKQNEESVRSIFANTPNVELDIIKYNPNEWPEFEADCKTLGIGYYGDDEQKPNEDFVQWFYRHANMTYEEKQAWCPIKKAAERILQTKVSDKFDYDFIHDVGSNGANRISYKTDRIIFRPGRDGSILKYVQAIENATEIHCIDSAFFHLVECINPKGKLFYHKTRPNSTNYNTIKNWTICK